jgi:predicted ester cyclase
MRGVEAFKAFLTELAAGLPDVSVTVGEMIAEDDKVACHWTMHGTHKGPRFGFSPTGKPVQISGLRFTEL